MLFLFLSLHPLCDTQIRPLLWPSPYFSVIMTVDAAIICSGNVTQSLSSNAAIFFYCRINIRISNIGKKKFHNLKILPQICEVSF